MTSSPLNCWPVLECQPQPETVEYFLLRRLLRDGMPWTFEITTGKLYDPSGNCVATGYSGGNMGKDPEGKNNPADESLKDIGPLPEGSYTLGDPLPQSHLGPLAIPLLPNPANHMFDRGGFYCHGDSVENPGCASEGCIIMPRNIRETMWHSTDHGLRVVANLQASAVGVGR